MRAYNLYSVVHATRVLPTRTESYPAHPAMPPAMAVSLTAKLTGIPFRMRDVWDRCSWL